MQHKLHYIYIHVSKRHGKIKTQFVILENEKNNEKMKATFQPTHEILLLIARRQTKVQMRLLLCLDLGFFL